MTQALDMAVRTGIRARLRADAVLGGLVETIDDGDDPVRTVPSVTLGIVTGDDWGAKDREGAELRIAIAVHDRSDALDVSSAAARRIVELIHGWPGDADALCDGWRVVATRVMRTRTVCARDGAVTAMIDARVRCWNA